MADLYYTPEQFACGYCDRTERIFGEPSASAEEQARAKGWRFGISGDGDQHCYCPECSGVNRRYWQLVPGVDTGSQAWGGGVR